MPGMRVRSPQARSHGLGGDGGGTGALEPRGEALRTDAPSDQPGSGRLL